MIGEPVTRQRGTPMTDANGDTYIDWTSPDELVIDGVAIAPRSEDEVHGAGRAGVIVGLTAYLPFDADVLFIDRIVARGNTYEVEGEIGQWRNPFTGNEWVATAALRKVDG